MGFLSTFPEYAIAAMLSVPLLKSIPQEERENTEEISKSREAQDMVTATALAYRTSQSLSLDGLENALAGVAACLYNLGADEGKVTFSEYRDMAITCVKSFCRECQSYQACLEENPAPCVENIEAIAENYTEKKGFFPMIPQSHLNTATIQRHFLKK